VRENVGAASNQRRQRRSPDMYIGYMSLMTDIIETEPSSFEEVVEKHVWVDAMVEEYNSNLNNNVLQVVPRPTDKSIVGSKWIFKVKNATNGSI